MTDNTCKTCKWWGGSDPAKRPITMVPRLCFNAKLGPQAASENDAAWDEESVCGGIATGPDFGCIHHEGKP